MFRGTFRPSRGNLKETCSYFAFTRLASCRSSCLPFSPSVSRLSRYRGNRVFWWMEWLPARIESGCERCLSENQREINVALR